MNFVAFVDDDGKIGIKDKAAWEKHLAKFAGHEAVVSIKRMPKRISSSQRSYYFGVVIPAIAQSQGETDPDNYESWHDGIAWRFLRIADGPLGQPRRRSTANGHMDSNDFSDYLSKVIQWAETDLLDCHIPRPGEQEIGTVYSQEFA